MSVICQMQGALGITAGLPTGGCGSRNTDKQEGPWKNPEGVCGGVGALGVSPGGGVTVRH